MLPLAREVHAFSPKPFCDMPVNEAEVQRSFVVSMYSPDGFVKVVEKDGEVVGCMVAMAFTNHWGIKVAQDLFLMSHGGSRMLIQSYKQWAREKEAVPMITDLCEKTGYRDLIKTCGFEAVGTNLIGAA